LKAGNTLGHQARWVHILREVVDEKAMYRFGSLAVVVAIYQ
jgi:hypothetical protein